MAGSSSSHRLTLKNTAVTVRAGLSLSLWFYIKPRPRSRHPQTTSRQSLPTHITVRSSGASISCRDGVQGRAGGGGEVPGGEAMGGAARLDGAVPQDLPPAVQEHRDRRGRRQVRRHRPPPQVRRGYVSHASCCIWP
jgi:hypothetical protein